MPSKLRKDSIVLRADAFTHWRTEAAYDVSHVISTLSLYW
jgi:hypothetical protein